MFKFKVDPAQVARVEAKVKKDVKEILEQPAVMKEVGAMVVERIRYQARISKPMNEDKNLPLLKEKTIANRRYLGKYNKTHATFDEGLSNLTITGALLNSLTFLVKGPGLIEIFFEGQHPRYKGKTGFIGKVVENSDLAKWLKIKGFAIYDNTINQNKMIKSRIKSTVLRYLRRGLKVRNDL